MSPFDGGARVSWRAAEPGGVLLSRIIYRRCFQKAFEPLMPYAIGLVELDVGLRLLAFLADPEDESSPRTGQRVRLEFQKVLPNGYPVPVVRAD